MANYNTIITPDEGLTCTAEEADAIQQLLDDDNDDDDGQSGFGFVYEGGEGYLMAEEAGNWDALPPAVVEKIAELLKRNNLLYLQFGVAFTCSNMRAGSHGGTAFRIYSNGDVVDRREEWP